MQRRRYMTLATWAREYRASVLVALEPAPLENLPIPLPAIRAEGPPATRDLPAVPPSGPQERVA